MAGTAPVSRSHVSASSLSSPGVRPNAPERPDEGGIAADEQVDREVDQALVLRGWDIIWRKAGAP
ncbi:hypothetical protein A5906_28745 [Bradyrhizobium sacchari]|nr:hypothetical protein A5906_28745 [Bradyrhizobium sacchari]